MTSGGRHSKKDVAAALDYAEEHDWQVEQTKSGHRWGVARCGKGCSVSIWSTPKNPGNHARRSAGQSTDVRMGRATMTRAAPPREYNFTLVIEGDVDDHLDELFEMGCDDATFGSVDGVQYAEFDRSARSLGQAVASAITAIESLPGLRVLRIEPDDLVTAAEIAERLGRSRESVRLLISGERGRGDFPAPVSHMRSRNRLWRWSDVTAWQGAKGAELSSVRLIAALNAALELRNRMPELPKRDRELIALLDL